MWAFLLKPQKWEYYGTRADVWDDIVDPNQVEGCVQFAYEKHNGKVKYIYYNRRVNHD